MLATIAPLLLAWQESQTPASGAEAHGVAEEHEHVLAAARAALERATVAQEAGDQATARTQVELVVELLAPLPLGEGHDETARVLWRVGELAYNSRNIACAREAWSRVLDHRERTLSANHADVLRVQGNLAVTMADMGDLAGARALEEAALALYERTLPEGDLLQLYARRNLARTMEKMGDFPSARELGEAVLATYERILPEDHTNLLDARESLAITMWAMGDLAGASAHGLDLARGMLRHVEAASLLSSRGARAATASQVRRHSLVRFLTRPQGNEAPAQIRFDLAESLRAISNVSSGARDGDSRRMELMGVRARLNDLVSGGPADAQTPEDFAAEIARLTLDRDRIEGEVRSEVASEGGFSGAIRAPEVAQALDDGAVAIGFLRQETLAPRWGGVLIAHVLFPDGSLLELELCEAGGLEESVRDWRSALGKPIERGLGLEDGVDRERETGRALVERFLDPLFEAVGEETKTLHICLDDFLHLVPIDALPIGDERVGDRYEIVNEVSFARLLSNRSPPAGDPELLAIGGAKFDAEVAGARTSTPPSVVAGMKSGDRSARLDTFAPLLQARFEVESVWALFDEEFEGGAILVTREKATKAAFHDFAPGKRYIHVATHGWFAPETIKSTLDPEPDADRLWSPTGARETVTGLAPLTLCGLAFAGANHGRDSLGRVSGILTAEDLAGIDLSACELAVLSACETNVGIRRAGQGIQSLQTALHAAGARTAITSLWKVDDAATRKLMERFYTYLWVEEMGKADALWKAKCDLRAEGHPVRDWAAWVLSGDPE